MNIIKVRSPFIVSVNEAAQIGSKIELRIYNNSQPIPTFLSSVVITGTAGQFSCSAATFINGTTVTISGNLGGTGSITGYTNPKTYYVIATNGTTTFTLSETLGGTAITTTAGTPTGLTYLTQSSGFYSLSKKIASQNQIENTYNISNYIREFIQHIQPTTVEEPEIESDSNWVYCRVNRYKETSGGYVSLGSFTQYLCLDGFTSYLDGNQIALTPDYYALKNTNQKVKYYNTAIHYVDLLIKRNINYQYRVRYYNAAGSSVSSYQILPNGAGAEIFNYKVPLIDIYTPSVKAKINLEDGSGNIISTLYEFNTEKVEECKYTPVLCNFVNRYGGWEFLTFFKQQTNNILVKGTDYEVLQGSTNYNTSIGQNKRFNINGRQSIKLNTGFVDENYSELITDLLLSETVLLDNKPVTLKTQGSDLKTVLKDRMINYELDFEYAYNLINDVV